jgi:hypothetical protein
MTGVCIVFFALGSYTIATISEMRSHRSTLIVRLTLTLGVGFDITATSFMIAGSRKIPLTFHGILGYSALLMMAIDMVLVWRRFRSHPAEPLPVGLRRYSIIAYSWWVLAFLAGIVVTVGMR